MTAPRTWQRMILVVMLMLSLTFGLFGCGAPKYNVDYCGAKYLYENAKDSYRAGSQVELVFTFVATDTDYFFYLDGEPVDYKYVDNCFVITFIMPEHDVVLECITKESMLPME